MKHYRTLLTILLLFIALSFPSSLFSAVDFDGADDYVTIGDAEWLDDDEGTVAMWIQYDDVAVHYERFFAKTSSSADDSWKDIMFLRIDEDDDHLKFIVYDTNAAALVDAESTTAITTAWTHIVISVSTAGGTKMYINGSEETPTYGTGSAATHAWFNDIASANKETIIGAFRSDTSAVPAVPFDGQVTEAYIWSSQLTDAQVLLLVNSKIKGIGMQIDSANLVGYWPLDDIPAGVPAKPNFHTLKDDANCMGAWAMSANNTTEIDLSGNSEDLTDATTSTSTSTSRMEGTTSRDFESGNTDYLYHADGGSTDIHGANQPISFSAWIKGETLGDNTILSKYDSSTNNQQYFFFIRGDDILQCNMSSDGATATGVNTATTVLLTGVWYHTAFVYNDTDMRIYVNGVLDSTPTAETAGLYDGNAQFAVGRIIGSGGPTNYFDGLIDEVMIFDRAISAQEVMGIYLTSAYNDLSGNGNHGTPQDGAGASASGMTQTGETVLSYPSPILMGQ